MRDYLAAALELAWASAVRRTTGLGDVFERVVAWTWPGYVFFGILLFRADTSYPEAPLFVRVLLSLVVSGLPGGLFAFLVAIVEDEAPVHATVCRWKPNTYLTRWLRRGHAAVQAQAALRRRRREESLAGGLTEVDDA